jgi:peptidyl-prolyl cis-trans isomerase SurA
MNKTVLFLIIYCFLFSLLRASASNASSINIVSSIGDNIITSHDVKSRDRLRKSIRAIGKDNILEIPLFPKSTNIKDQLKKELIVKIFAENYNINFTKDEIINETYKIYSKYNISYNKLKKNIFKNNQDIIEEYNKYMASYLLWMKIIRQKIIPEVNISYPELSELAQINKIQTNKKKLKIYEIFLEDDNLKDKALDKIKNLSDFKKFAKKYSQSPTSSNGGLMGWMMESDFNENIRFLIKDLEINKLSKAQYRKNDGYYLYMLEDRKTIDFIDPKIKDIIHNALLEKKIIALISKFFIEAKRELL